MTPRSLALGALLLCALAFFVDAGAIAVASFAMRPESDGAAALMVAGSALAFLSNVAAVVLGIVALVRGRREGVSIALGIGALLIGLGGLVMVPVAWVMWILMATPIGIH